MNKKKISVYILSTSVLFSSCVSDNIFDLKDINQSELLEVNSTKSNYTGEQLFKSIYFLGDDVKVNTDYFNEIIEYKVSLSNEVVNEVNLMGERVIKIIKENDSDYFSTLRDAIYKGDNYEIEFLLEKGSDYIVEFLPEVPEYRDAFENYSQIYKSVDFEKYINEEGEFLEDEFLEDLEDNNINPNFALVTPTIIAAAVALFVVQTVGFGVSYWVAVMVQFYTPWDKQIKRGYDRIINSKNSLSKEIFIQQLVDEV